MRALKKSKKDLEMQLKDQEEELDDLAAQVYFLSYLLSYLLSLASNHNNLTHLIRY